MKLDLVSTPEIADLFGVSRQRAHIILRSAADFPEPVAELRTGKIWLRKDVVRWAKKNGRVKT